MIRYLKNLGHFVLAIIASIVYRFPGRSLVVIGVTGTDGKTTTATMIYDILKAEGVSVSLISTVHAVIGGTTYDTGFHVTSPHPFALQKYLRRALDEGSTHVVLEVTSHGLDQHRVAGIPFHVGVLTNITHEHLDYHKTYEDYARTKLSLLTRSSHAVLPVAYRDAFHTQQPTRSSERMSLYGTGNDAQFTKKNTNLRLQIPGQFNIENGLAAVAASHVVNIPTKRAVKTLAAFTGIVGRMETVYDQSFRVIIDFAHTPNALSEALKTAKKTTQGKLISVFGCAGLRDYTKRPMMGAIAAEYADHIVLTEEDYRTESIDDIFDQIMKDMPPKTSVKKIPNRQDAITNAISIAKKGDTVIITGKGHEASLCRGTKEYPWSDHKGVARALKKLGYVRKNKR